MKNKWISKKDDERMYAYFEPDLENAYVYYSTEDDKMMIVDFIGRAMWKNKVYTTFVSITGLLRSENYVELGEL